MKILHVIPYFVPAWAYGGPVRVVFEISKKQLTNGHDITVFTTDVKDEGSRCKNKEEILDGIKVFRFPTISNKLSWTYKGFISIPMAVAFVKNIKNFDLVNIHEYYTFQVVVASLVSRIYNVPYLISTHGSVLDEEKRGQVIIKKIFNLLFSKLIFNGAATIFVLNEAEKKILMSLGVSESNIAIIPNGIESKNHLNISLNNVQRVSKRLNRPKMILYMGRIYKTKGLDLLINSLSYLNEKIINEVRLIIVGPIIGDYKKELISLARRTGVLSNIKFMPPEYSDKKFNYYVHADLYVQPSYSDGFPLSVLEALACKVPTLVTSGTNLSYLSNKGAVLMVDTNPESIARGITVLLNDNKLRQEQMKKAEQVINRYLSWDRIVNSMEIYYKRALK